MISMQSLNKHIMGESQISLAPVRVLNMLMLLPLPQLIPGFDFVHSALISAHSAVAMVEHDRVETLFHAQIRWIAELVSSALKWASVGGDELNGDWRTERAARPDIDTPHSRPKFGVINATRGVRIGDSMECEWIASLLRLIALIAAHPNLYLRSVKRYRW